MNIYKFKKQESFQLNTSAQDGYIVCLVSLQNLRLLFHYILQLLLSQVHYRSLWRIPMPKSGPRQLIANRTKCYRAKREQLWDNLLFKHYTLSKNIQTERETIAGCKGNNSIQIKAVRLWFFSRRQSILFPAFVPFAKVSDCRHVLSLFLWSTYLHWMNGNISFFNEDLDEQVFIEQPSRYEQGNHAELVCCLDLAIYRLNWEIWQWLVRVDILLTDLLGLPGSSEKWLLYVKPRFTFIINLFLQDDD